MVITLVGPQSLAGFPKVQSLAPCSFCYMLMIFRYLWTAQSYYLLIMPRSFDQLDVLRRKVDGWIDDLKTLSLFPKHNLMLPMLLFVMVSLSDGTFFFSCFFCSTDLFLPLEHFVKSVSFLVYWVELSLVMLRESYLPCLCG